MNESFWSFALSYAKIFSGICFLAVICWFSYLIIKRSRTGKKYIGIEALRILTACVILFTLLRPEIVRLTRITEQPLIAVLCDESGSMTTKDVVTDKFTALERKEWITVQRENKFWAPLEEKYKIVVNNIAAIPERDQKNKTEYNPGTDLNAALEETLNNYNNLRAIILLSDGDWNMGASPMSAATKLYIRDIPVFPVVVGSDKFLPDLDLQSVSAPAYGLMDEHISLPFTIQSRLPKSVKTTVTLTGPSGMEASKTITIPPMAQFQDSIILTPRIEGDHKFELKLPVDKGEIFSHNNTKEFRISLRHELLKVLIVESTPRWEYRFLHNALSRDPGVDVSCLLLHPDMEPGKGKNYIQSFPDTKEKLSKYDVVFIGDIGAGRGGLSKEDMIHLKGLVERQGSGLVFLPGRRGKQAELLDGALGDMIPVVMNEARSEGIGYSMESKISLTTRGKDHLLTMLAPDPQRNYSVWKQLPGAFWHASVVKAKPGTSVLAVHSTARNEHGRLPVLVTRNYGNGKVLFMGTDNAWRWRRGVEDTYHYRFWGQVVRWMAHQRHLAHIEGVRFFFSPESPNRGNTIFLHSTVFDKSGFPLKEGVVEASITSPSGQNQKLNLTTESGGWGVFTGDFTPREGGTYSVVINCEKHERKLKTEIIVNSPVRELIGKPSRASVMREIASITGGQFGTTAELESIVKNVSLLPESRPVEERLRLWCHPLWAGLIVVMLGAYWTLRKLLGMI